MIAAPNPSQSPRGGNGRVASFSNTFWGYGEPIRYVDSGLSKETYIKEKLGPLREQRELLREQRAAEYAKIKANAAEAREAAMQRRREQREARERAKREAHEREQAVMMLQRNVRRYHNRKNMKDTASLNINDLGSAAAIALEKRRRGALCIEAAFSAWREREKPSARYELRQRLQAASKLQNHFRMSKIRGDYLLRLSWACIKQNEDYFATLKHQLESEASEKIQASWRGGKVRNPKGFQRRRQAEAAVVLQSSFRGHKSRKHDLPFVPKKKGKGSKRSRELPRGQGNYPSRRSGTFPRDGS